MADFQVPFANTGTRRSPSVDEKANGFGCGPADQALFNGMFHRLEAEIGEVISHAGLTGTDTDFSQLRKSIVALIESATGGGEEVSTYLLLSQAIARLPIYPNVLTSDGKIAITAPSTGTVRVPGSISFVHRGVSSVVTEETDLATVSSKTYHLRWNPTDGFALKDIGDSGYNPSTLAENDVSFDTTFDDMLVARVVTNSSNVATITSLVNLDRVHQSGKQSMSGTTPHWSSTTTTDTVLNWARKPMASMASSEIIGDYGPGAEVSVGVQSNDRYSIGCFYRRAPQVNETGQVNWNAWL